MIDVASGRSRVGLLVALGIDNLGSGMFLPLSLVFVTQVVGLGLALAGTLVTVGSAVGLLLPPLAGRAVDRVGPKSVVICSQLLQAAGALAYFVATGPALTVLAAVLLAGGQQIFYSSLFALIADTSHAGPKDRPFAVVNLVRGVAFGTGGIVAALLLSTVGTDGLRAAVLANASSFLVCAGLVAVLVRPAVHRVPDGGTGAARPSVLGDRPFLALIAITAFVALVIDFFLVGIPVYVLDVLDGPSWLPGVILALLTFGAATTGTLAVRLTQHVRRTSVMRLGAAVYVGWAAMCLAAFELPAVLVAPWLLLATLVLAVGSLLFGGKVNALAEAVAPPAARGRYLAALQYAFAVPQFVTPSVVALFAVGFWVPWVVVAGSCVLAIVGLTWLAPKLPAHAQSASAL